MNPVSERIANMSIPTVIIVVLVLLGIRFALRKQDNKILKQIAELAEALGVALGLVFLIIRPFIIQAFYIPSESMVPTLLKKDQILVNKFIYRFTPPKTGDVVVFLAPPEANPPGDTTPKDFIKRVIAVPGDVIRFTQGYVLVDNVQYGHTELAQALLGFKTVDGFGSIKLTKDGVFVDGQKISNAEIGSNLADNPKANVKVVAGRVFLNGKELNEPYIAEDSDKPYPNGETNPEWVDNKNGVAFVKVPPGRLLVCGDNRNNSNDARFWGLLDRTRLKGKAMFIFFPFPRVRWIH